MLHQQGLLSYERDKVKISLHSLISMFDIPLLQSQNPLFDRVRNDNPLNLNGLRLTDSMKSVDRLASRID
jgi:hypothetical protein